MQADLDLERGELLVELGCGTGPFTRLLEHYCREGGLRYLGVELDPELHDYLVRRHPALDFVARPAQELPAILAERGLPPAAALISGLPLGSMDAATQTAILDAALPALRPGGELRHFTYAHYQIWPSARRLRRLLRERFENVHVRSFVAWNLPPAIVLSATRPRARDESTA